MGKEDYKSGMQMTGGDVPIVEEQPQVDGVIRKGAFMTFDGGRAYAMPSMDEIADQVDAADPSDIADRLAAAKRKLEALASAIHKRPMQS